VFFVLSGFLLGMPFWVALDERGELPSLRTYFLRRAARLVPATWVCLIVSSVVGLWLNVELRPGHELPRLLAGMLFLSDWHWTTLFPVDVNGPLWSLSFEVSSYVLMALAFLGLRYLVPSFSRGWRARVAWAFVIASALIVHGLFSVLLKHDSSFTGWHYGLSGGARSWFPRYNAFAFFAMFATGTFAAGMFVLQEQRPSSRPLTMRLAAVSGLLCIMLLVLGCLRYISIEKPPYAFPALPVAVAIFLLAASTLPLRKSFENRIITYLADISFGIYIWHSLLLAILAQSLPSTIEPHFRALTIVFGTITGTFVIAHFSFFLFERPIMQRARLFETLDKRKLETSTDHKSIHRRSPGTFLDYSKTS
jgi:peptidoglycan/LPS O-acetylase OafA/YrhL